MRDVYYRTISCDQGPRVAKPELRSDNNRCRPSHIRHGSACLFGQQNRLFLESLSRSQECAHIYISFNKIAIQGTPQIVAYNELFLLHRNIWSLDNYGVFK